MKVTGFAVVLALCSACAMASPMFGTGGMMKRKFPGSSDMSYRIYREIANSNTQQRVEGNSLATPAVVTRSGDRPQVDAWMFNNDVPEQRVPFSASRPADTFNRQGVSSYEPEELDSEEQYLYQYPSAFSPRESYAFINFPYQAPSDLQYRNSVGSVQYHRKPSYPYYY